MEQDISTSVKSCLHSLRFHSVNLDLSVLLRTLSDMRGECVAAGRQLHSVFMDLEAGAVERSSPGAETAALETQLKDKLREAMQLQGRWDAEKVELNSRSDPD